MKPLVYDFGKLDDSTENDYTEQMVKDRCISIQSLREQQSTIKSIAKVVTWSQSYMKKRTVCEICNIGCLISGRCALYPILCEQCQSVCGFGISHALEIL